MFKKIINKMSVSQWIILFILIVFFAYNIKTIPNYSKYGDIDDIDIVWKSNYDKYQKGYCLDEDRILSDEEIYTKAITQFLEKRVVLHNKINEYRDYTYGTPVIKPKPVGYYLLSGIDADNWYEKFSAKYDKSQK